MIISGLPAIVFAAENNADIFLQSKGQTVIRHFPETIRAELNENIADKIKEWENKGYTVKDSLIQSKDGTRTYYAYKNYAKEERENYQKEKLRFMYYYIGEHSSFQDAERIIREKCEEKGLDFDAIDPRSPHCFNDDHYCSLFCPYYKEKCSLTVEDFEKHGLQKQYYHLEKDYFLSQLHRGRLL